MTKDVQSTPIPLVHSSVPQCLSRRQQVPGGQEDPGAQPASRDRRAAAVFALHAARKRATRCSAVRTGLERHVNILADVTDRSPPGYTFLYTNNAARSGNQIDRSINSTQSPSFWAASPSRAPTSCPRGSTRESRSASDGQRIVSGLSAVSVPLRHSRAPARRRKVVSPPFLALSAANRAWHGRCLTHDTPNITAKGTHGMTLAVRGFRRIPTMLASVRAVFSVTAS